jgi:hypothetical protein
VAKVGVTGVANGLDALEERRPVKPAGNDIILDGLERRPTGVGLEFLGRIERNAVAQGQRR